MIYIHLKQLLFFCVIIWSCFIQASLGDKCLLTNLIENSENVKLITNKIRKFAEQNSSIQKSDRTIVIYNLNSTSADQAFEVLTNNLIIFTSSIKNDLGKDSKNFYLFNIRGSITLSNYLIQYLPQPGPNVAWLTWKLENSSNNNFRSLTIFKDIIIQHFYNFIFLSDKERGPFHERRKGTWIQSIRNELFLKNIALYGSSIKCDSHSQILGLLSIPTSFINEFLKNILISQNCENYDYDLIQSLLFKYFQRKEYKIASEHYQKRTHLDYFNGKCIETEYQWSNLNPSTWCDLKQDDMNFFIWDESLLRKPGVICEKLGKTMNILLESLNKDEPNIGLIFPEILGSGNLYSLYKDYQAEMELNKPLALLITAINERDKKHFSLKTTESITDVSTDKIPSILPSDYNSLADHVCLAVRSSKNNDIPFYDEFDAVASIKSFKKLLKHPILTGIQDLILCKKENIANIFPLF